MAAETVPQYLEALHRANEVRLARAQLKRELRSGERHPAEVLANVPNYAEGMQAIDFLMALPRWGTTRSRKLLACVPCRENKTLGSMTERQRRALARLLGGAHGPR